MTSIEALKADMHRLSGHFTWGKAIRAAVAERCFRVLFTLRMSQHCSAGGPFSRAVGLVWRFAHRLSTSRAGLDMPWNTSIGGGLAINHGWGIVINAKARIGKNVTLFHGVTLGRKDRIEPDGTRTHAFPTIEDEAWIGPHAVIVGGVTVGKGSIVGAGAVVVYDVPAGSVIAGNPAVVLRSDCLPDVVNRAPI